MGEDLQREALVPVGWQSLKACGYLLGQTREVPQPQAREVAALLDRPVKKTPGGTSCGMVVDPGKRYAAQDTTFLLFTTPDGRAGSVTLSNCGDTAFGAGGVASLAAGTLQRVRALVGLDT